MAVRAPDDALGELLLQKVERTLVHDQLRDVGGLGADMIEIENDGIPAGDGNARRRPRRGRSPRQVARVRHLRAREPRGRVAFL